MDNISPWFALKSVPGIGNILFKRLIDRFKAPQAVFEAPEMELLKIEGVSLRLVAALRRQKVPDKAKRELDVAARKGYRIVTQADPEYPPLLHQLPDPPPFFYLYGHLSPEKLHIAVIGSRHATQYGLTTANRLSYELGNRGIIVVSGMARGIDTAAHQGALRTQATTIAILGSGLEKIYPPENKKLFHQIAAQGAVISEFHLFADPEAHHFPIRNRIISGITQGTVVVEAGSKSGSLITARLAAEQNREVFAVPGNINSLRSAGTHALIKQGAKLVENVDDILEEFQVHFPKGNTAPTPNMTSNLPEIRELSLEEQSILRHLEPYPIHMDELVRSVGMDSGKVANLLLQLEIKGLITQAPGKFFSLLIDISSSPK